MNKTYYLFELGDKTESSAGLISTLCDFGGIDNHSGRLTQWKAAEPSAEGLLQS